MTTDHAATARLRRLVGLWSGDDRRSDVTTAVTLFVLGWLFLQVGLVDLFNGGPFGATTPEPWWRVALLAVGCALTLAKRSRPMLALAGGVGVTLVDLAWGGSLAILLVLWDLLYAAAMWSGTTARRWLWGTAIVLSVAGAVAAGESSRDVRAFVYAGLNLGAILLVPMWWATNVRQKSELAAVERSRADEARRTAELERERAADLARIAELDRHEAVRAERAAMARDLHDVIASHLSTIAIHSGAALSTPPDAARDRGALEQVRASAVASLTEMRSMIGLLRADAPRDPLAAPGRLDRLDDLLDVARAAGTAVTTEDPGGVARADLPAAVGHALYRIAQEALTNARKHAPGAPVTVRLARGPRPRGGAVLLEVRNAPPPTGPGPAVDAAGMPLSAGTGMLTMRERAEALGGTFEAGATDDGGWAVRARVPAGAETGGRNEGTAG
ncbi:sensor histidine kinase [Krasilnikoviella flava]|uniref:histidine kinase n=1 Tax=Krasilnikoviella flava TaxID=526729 RepID=A0A1T5LL78_9MICO|nr:histidine kinase [Krasilnikoviella flava]SKC76359.1 Signal transduction histidine kinase [Krasilnikoviella flava]